MGVSARLILALLFHVFIHSHASETAASVRDQNEVNSLTDASVDTSTDDDTSIDASDVSDLSAGTGRRRLHKYLKKWSTVNKRHHTKYKKWIKKSKALKVARDHAHKKWLKKWHSLKRKQNAHYKKLLKMWRALKKKHQHHYRKQLKKWYQMKRKYYQMKQKWNKMKRWHKVEKAHHLQKMRHLNKLHRLEKAGHLAKLRHLNTLHRLHKQYYKKKLHMLKRMHAAKKAHHTKKLKHLKKLYRQKVSHYKKWVGGRRRRWVVHRRRRRFHRRRVRRFKLTPQSKKAYKFSTYRPKGTYLGTLTTKKNFVMEWHMRPIGKKVSSWASIVHITTGLDKDATRLPGVWFWPRTRKLHVCITKARNRRWVGQACANCLNYELQKGKKYHVKVQVKGKRLDVIINGKSRCHKNLGTHRTGIWAAKVYAPNPWYHAANVKLWGLKYYR